MNWTRAFWLGLAVLGPLLGGCVTRELWQEQAFREPWPAPHLKLALDPARKDVLVCYDELNDRSDQRHPRAYYLFRNEQRIRQGRKPSFVSPARAAKLAPVPVFMADQPVPGMTNLEYCAVAGTNRTSFQLYAKGRELGEFYLPVYKDGVWLTQKALLMPLAVGADATILGGYLGLLYWRGGGYGFTVKP